MFRFFITAALFASSLVADSSYPKEFDRCFYNKEESVIFINLPKCGTTFVRKALGNLYFPTDLSNIPKKVKDDAVTFLVVRDPVSRAISGYLEVMKCRKDALTDIKNFSFYKNRNNVTLSFHEYLLQLQNGFFDRHHYPQSYIFDIKGFTLEDVCYVLDLANLTFDLKEFSKLFDVPIYLYIGLDKNHGNSKHKSLLKKFVKTNPHIKELVETIYAEDVDFYKKCMQRRAAIQKRASLLL